MAKHIWEIEPSTISRDLTGKYVLLYGKEKSGKTTAACMFPKPVLLAFEKGYNAIGNAYPYDVSKWSDFKYALRDLEDARAKAMFKTVIIDTVPIAWDLCEQHICIQNGVQKISDIPWGAGYTACRKEFESSLRKITQLGYGVVLIAHSVSRIEKDAEGSEKEIISPDLPKRAAEVCNGLVDIIGYIGNEFVNGEAVRYLYTRETPTLFAGSRFKYLAPKIPFGYNELVNALAEAIRKSEELDGVQVVDSDEVEQKEEAKLDFNSVRQEAQTLWSKLVSENEENSNVILKKVEMIMGHKMKLSEFTEDQVDLFQMVVEEMRSMVKG